MRILALVPGEIGDQILFFPTLADLKQRYPNAAIDVMVEPRSKAAYRVCQYVNEVLTFDYKDRSSLADYLNLLGVIRDREYDAAIATNIPWTVGVILWLNGIPVRVGYKSESSWYLSNPVELKQEQYLAHMYHDLVQGLGIYNSCPELKINVPRQDIDWAETEQQRLEIKDTGYILIYDRPTPIASSDGVNVTYPIAQWKQIIKDIQTKQPSVPVVLLQDLDNEAWIKSIFQPGSNLKKTTPSDIGKTAAIVAGANLVLCVDSAPMYLSIAVGNYTIALLPKTKASILLPSNTKNYVGLESTTDRVADIKPETILERIWQS